MPCFPLLSSIYNAVKKPQRLFESSSESCSAGPIFMGFVVDLVKYGCCISVLVTFNLGRSSCFTFNQPGPKMGECDRGENVTAYSEDERKIKKLGEPEVNGNESLVNKDDNAPQLDIDSTNCNYGKVPLIRHNSPDTGRPLPSVNEDAIGGSDSNLANAQVYTTSSQLEQKARVTKRFKRRRYVSLISTDTTTRNYGRAPLIEDIFNDSARPLPSVNEDAFGGGITMRCDQRDSEAVVQVSNVGQGYKVSVPPDPRILLPQHKSIHPVNPTINVVHPSEQESIHQVNQTVTIHPPEQKSTHQLSPTAEIIDKVTNAGLDYGVSAPQVSFPVHPQKSTDPVNPNNRLERFRS
ncbi:hypothetical protein KSS87_007741 [Heliosperma pusillum]|nr:hypothetical protein KSS87_007741 [Heliosperma pusillum]